MGRKRGDGFYWVKFKGAKKFEICEFCKGTGGWNDIWCAPGSDIFFDEEYFEEIDERRIVRDE